jgi:hypothetical protein
MLWLSAEKCYNYNINSNIQDTTALQTKVVLMQDIPMCF